MTPPLSAWPALAGLTARPLAGGLINDTFSVGRPPRAVVQRLHRIFAPEVNLDIVAVTAHLDARGLVTPKVLPTEHGWWTVDAEGGCWRALTWVPGVTVHAVDSPARAAEAGALVARWHAATSDLEHDFAFSRPGAHDTVAHMAKLRGVLDQHRSHRLYEQVAPVAHTILASWDRWDGRLDLPPRIAHGDLKISNLRFGADGRGICLLDLDTMGMLPIDVELGDAWRSWCNRKNEDASDVRFDVELFAASAGAYLAEQPLEAETREALPGGVERIGLELASRFCADALEERYFGWSVQAAPTRGDHNLLRARGQLALAQSARASRHEMELALRGPS